jgi:hypothetical protein
MASSHTQYPRPVGCILHIAMLINDEFLSRKEELFRLALKGDTDGVIAAIMVHKPISAIVDYSLYDDVLDIEKAAINGLIAAVDLMMLEYRVCVVEAINCGDQKSLIETIDSIHIPALVDLD